MDAIERAAEILRAIGHVHNDMEAMQIADDIIASVARLTEENARLREALEAIRDERTGALSKIAFAAAALVKGEA